MDKDQIQGLVRRIQDSKDEAAFAEIYEEFADRIYAFISIKTFGNNDKEDILQEVFIKAWQGCQKLSLQDLNFSAWLYKITYNTVNDYYRKKYSKAAIVPLKEVTESIAKDRTADEVSQTLYHTIIKNNLDLLPIHYKQVIELRFFQEFTLKETAKILNKNSVTVRVWQHRAIKLLEQLFKKYERLI